MDVFSDPLLTLFARQASARPSDPAVIGADGSTTTYAELDRASAALAGHLRRIAVAPGSPVAVYVEDRSEMPTAWLGVLRSGAPYVPIDPRQPVPRTARVLEEAGASVLIGTGDLPPGIRRQLPTFVDIGGARLGDAGAQPVDTGLTNDLAYITYTSGSTGSPKGIAIRRAAVAALVEGCDYAALGPTTAMAQISNPAFDAATFEVWGSLLTGGLLRVINESALFGVRDILAATGKSETVAFLTTPLFNSLALTMPHRLLGLSAVIFGGEQANAQAIRQVLASGFDGMLVNGYGPTETTTFAATWTVPRALSLADEQRVPIGQPVAGTRISVRNAALERLPDGMVGELCIGGLGVGAGYVRRPGLTADRFVPDPEGPPGSRMHRSGDRGRVRPDGNFEVIGRTDDQVKVGGYRVELSEVEQALRRVAGVSEAVVIAQASGGRTVLAAVITRSDTSVDSAHVRDILSAELPGYMVPRSIVISDSLPVSSVGKIDRQALRARFKDDRVVDDLEEDDEVYVIVRNESGHQALWPLRQEVPAGWQAQRFVGSRAACVTHVDATSQ
ncbi:MAG TPA: amino acid adenylation domain-containing protein [Actinomycetota bacterium]|nr:amino acid adenylation domain-containing protein [Actinomycetota bacterium]